MLDPSTVTCPLCGAKGRVWDNRTDKRSDKSPDLKCKECKAVCWLDPDGRSWRWAPAR